MTQLVELVPKIRGDCPGLPEDYEAIYQQMLSEMHQPDFVAPWGLLTAWGINPPKKKAVPTPE